MAKTRALAAAVAGIVLLSGLSGCGNQFLVGLTGVVPVPPWVSERMEEKYAKRLQLRTPVMPPILPGMPLPACEDPPSEEEVVRALPKVVRGLPFVFEEQRDDYVIIIDKLVDRIDPCVYVPLLGPAQLHHCHFKCTVHWKERLIQEWPFPYMIENDRCEVVYIDKDHYHLCVDPNDPRKAASVFRDLAGH
jgi:hypothetical protein